MEEEYNEAINNFINGVEGTSESLNTLNTTSENLVDNFTGLGTSAKVYATTTEQIAKLQGESANIISDFSERAKHGIDSFFGTLKDEVTKDNRPGMILAGAYAGFGVMENAFTSLASQIKIAGVDLSQLVKNVAGVKMYGATGYGETDDNFKLAADFDKDVKNLNKELGFSFQQMENINKSLQEGANITAQYGATYKDLVTMQRSFSENLRSARVLSEQEFENIAKITDLTGMSFEDASKYFDEMSKYGTSMEKLYDVSRDVLSISEAYGINALSVQRKMNDLAKESQRFNFKDGVEGFARMTADSEKMKTDLNAMLNLTDELAGVDGMEKALELGAQLQMLGGEFADFDPFEAMYLARNDPEKFQEKIVSLTKSMGRLNQETGEIEFSPVDRNMLQMFSQYTGQSFESLKEQINQREKLRFIQEQNLGLTEEEQQKLSQMASISDGTVKLTVEGQLTDVSTMTADQISKMLNNANATTEEIIRGSQGYEDIMQRSTIAVENSLLRHSQTINEITKEYFKNMDEVQKEFGDIMSEDDLRVFSSFSAQMSQITQAGIFQKGMNNPFFKYNEAIGDIVYEQMNTTEKFQDFSNRFEKTFDKITDNVGDQLNNVADSFNETGKNMISAMENLGAKMNEYNINDTNRKVIIEMTDAFKKLLTVKEEITNNTGVPTDAMGN